MIGGVCINTGTIPSKTLREAVLYLTGMAQRDLYGASYRVKDEISISDLTARTQHVIGRETEIVRNQLLRNHVHMLSGTARFVDDHTIEVSGPDHIRVTADKIVLAPGTEPARPPHVEFADGRVVDSDGILDLDTVPGSMVVVGAGVIGIEYASMFAALGTRVTVVDQRPSMLEFCDEEIVESLRFHLRDLAVSFRFGELVDRVEVTEFGTVTSLQSGKRIPAETCHVFGRALKARPRISPWSARASMPTSAAGSASMRTSARACRTSTRSATSSASRHSPRRRWSRGGSPRCTRWAKRPAR